MQAESLAAFLETATDKKSEALEFGQLGEVPEDGRRTLVQPRFQVGLRWRPIDRFSMDLILGRNITGENANWITVGLNLRFEPPK